jgi:hypothetical protein
MNSDEAPFLNFETRARERAGRGLAPEYYWIYLSQVDPTRHIHLLPNLFLQ